MYVFHMIHVCLIYRGIKASHVLISKNGQVCLTGLHNSYNTIQNGKKLRKVHDFPIHSVDCLQSFSPELLHQVRDFIYIDLDLTPFRASGSKNPLSSKACSLLAAGVHFSEVILEGAAAGCMRMSVSAFSSYSLPWVGNSFCRRICPTKPYVMVTMYMTSQRN